MAEDFAIDMSPLKAFGQALKHIEPRLARMLRSDLREAGEEIAELARAHAHEHSTSIPGTVAVRMVGLQVFVGAGTKDEPLAGLYEEGNKRSGFGTMFRHPVFGNADTWVTQPRYPFLKKAAREGFPLFMERVGRSVDTTVRAAIRDT